MKKGFTLIELLVVVLIIGILAAVAIPQYQKAVDKARFVQGITALKSLIDVEQIYYLANGTYATRLDELDLNLPNNKVPYFNSFSIDTNPNVHIQMLYHKRIDNKSVWLVAYLTGADRPLIVCGVPSGTAVNSPARKFCRNVMGTDEHFVGEPGYDAYPLSL